MKHETKARPRAIALLLAAVALPATPAIAQDVAPLPAPTVTPPPAPAPAPTATVPVTPPPVVRTTAPTPAPTITLPQVAQPAPAPEAEAPPTEPRAAREPARPRPAARRAAPAAPAAEPVAAAPAPAVDAPVEPLPAPVAEPIAPPVAEAPAAPVEAAPEAQPETGGTSWLPIAAVLAVLAAAIAGFFLMRRRRREEDYYEPAYEEAVYEETPPETALEPVVTPVTVEKAPERVMPRPIIDPALAAASFSPTLAPAHPVEQAPVVEEPAAVAAETAVEERPWIDLAMRPVRAGTSENEAVVEFELTVENNGNLPAENVKVSTWMFSTDPTQSDAEQMLIEPPADSRLAKVDIQPGDGKQMEATLALPKSALAVVGSPDHRAGFRPVVVADARYPLPDGGEGRISASFEIGLQSETGELVPLHVDGAPELREDIEARLHGELERA